MKLASILKMLILVAPTTGLLPVADSILAQGVPEVVTMKSGLQYEGVTASTAAIIEGTSIYSEIGAQNIVRIDDGLRQVFVNENRIANFGESNRIDIEIPIFQRLSPGSDGLGSIVRVGPFNEQGHRELIIRPPGSPDPLVYIQGITKITPRYCVVQTLAGAAAKPIEWKMCIATGTVPIHVLRSLLRTQIGDPSSPTEHLKIAEFFLQAQLFGQAIEELRFLQKKFPDLEERINDDRILIRQAFARQILREIRLRMDAGQSQIATDLAKAFDKQDLAGEILAEFTDLENRAQESTRQLDSARGQINQLIEQTQNLDPSQSAAVQRLKDELETDLNPINALRLDACLRLANDATMPSPQKLALAISGWMMGSNNAIENLAIAQGMFEVRDLVQTYLRSTEAPTRMEILKQLAEFEAGSPKYLAPLIRQMNPIEGPDLSQYSGEQPIEFNVTIPGPAIHQEPQHFRCLALLPPEYDPYRRYPLLVALPGGSQTVEQYLDMLCGGFDSKLNVRVGHAARNGYIVVAVDWRLPGQIVYGYTAREHALVMKALREALRTFSIDEDRVFLSGHGIGGDAAYDIGLSHPEHWAGVIGVSGKIDRYANVYQSNKHWALPVYSVVGGKDYPTIVANNGAWNKWLPTQRYLDCTVVMYNGRGNELFVEEIPETFKWMNAQRRRWPDKSGFSFECRTLRPWDCYFWFLEFDGIADENVVWPEDWREAGIPRMTMTGSIKAETPNQFRVGPSSLQATNGATMWLSPEFVNFDESIQIKGLGNDFKGFVKPTTEILLEDIRRRADRAHPFWGRIDLQGSEWIPKG